MNIRQVGFGLGLVAALVAVVPSAVEAQERTPVLVVPNDTSEVAATYSRYVTASLEDLGYTARRIPRHGDRPKGWDDYYEVTIAVLGHPEMSGFTATVIFNWVGVYEQDKTVRTPPKAIQLQWHISRPGFPEAAQRTAEAVADRVDWIDKGSSQDRTDGG